MRGDVVRMKKLVTVNNITVVLRAALLNVDFLSRKYTKECK